jgi:hypothetical protein
MTYPEKEKVKCASLYIAGHSIRDIAKKREPGKDAISDWKDEQRWEEQRQKVQNELNLDEESDKIRRVKQQFIENLPAVASKLVSEINRRAAQDELKDESLSNLTTAFGIIIDKWQLLTGEATERVESKNVSVMIEAMRDARDQE